MEVAILMTCHDRRERTLSCLLDCYRQIDGLKGNDAYSFDCWVVDDGSSDGTYEAISQEFPQVHLIKADGNLFWNQGMRLAWTRASQEKDYDFYIWLNDDIRLREWALAAMLETSEFFKHRAIVAGTAVDSEGRYSYGGRTKSMKIVEPDPVIPLPCYMFNGNLVLVPRSAYQILGNLDDAYSHSFGDYDYGVRALRHGIPRVVCPGVLCECDRNAGIPKWRDASYPLKARFSYLLSPKGRPPKEQFLFDIRLMGIVRAMLHNISINLKMLFPLKNSSRRTNDEQD